MAKADVLALVDAILIKPDTSGDAEDFYDEVIRELGFLEYLTNVRTLEVAAGEPYYPVHIDMIRVLEADLRGSGRLHPASGEALRAAYGGAWRNRRGTPYHLTRTDESSDLLRLFPVPVAADQLTLIYTDIPVDVPYWLELPVALEVAARMLTRESAGQDLAVAAQAKALAALFFVLLEAPFMGGGAAKEAGGAADAAAL